MTQKQQMGIPQCSSWQAHDTPGLAQRQQAPPPGGLRAPEGMLYASVQMCLCLCSAESWTHGLMHPSHVQDADHTQKQHTLLGWRQTTT